jgi:hypothetical protein
MNPMCTAIEGILQLAIEGILQLASKSLAENDLQLQEVKKHVEQIRAEIKTARRNGTYVECVYGTELFTAENRVKLCAEKSRLAEVAHWTCVKAQLASTQMVPGDFNYLEFVTATCAEASACHASTSPVKSARLAWMEACHVVTQWDHLLQKYSHEVHSQLQ